MTSPTNQVLFAVPYVSAAASSFLARTSGLDTTHTNAYTALINGLVSDGVWSLLDALYIFATQDETTALLNLVQSTYNATKVSTPAFVADRGYTGAAGPKYIATNFTPSTASSPNFVRNSAHISAWSVTNIGADSQPQMGTNDGSNIVDVFPNFSNSFFAFMNSGTAITVSNTNSAGHYISNRSSSTALQGYKNGSSVMSSSANNSSGVPSSSIIVGGQNNNGSISPSSYQNAAASIGASLDATAASNLYNRLRTYMTAVGVP